MDIEQELEKTFKIPTALLSFLAIVTGILILFFPYILNILIAFFLVVYGLIKAFELGNKPKQETSTVSSTSLHSIHQIEEDSASNINETDSN